MFEKKNNKQRLVIWSVFSTISLIASLAYGLVLIKLMIFLIKIPSKEFTPKLTFVSIILFYVIYKLFAFMCSATGAGINFAKESYKKLNGGKK